MPRYTGSELLKMGKDTNRMDAVWIDGFVQELRKDCDYSKVQCDSCLDAAKVIENLFKNVERYIWIQDRLCSECRWANRKRPQKCNCCRRNLGMKDNFELSEIGGIQISGWTF